jgi:hypothetical protein
MAYTAVQFTCCTLHAGILLGLFFDHEDGGDMVLEKRWPIFNELHGVTYP